MGIYLLGRTPERTQDRQPVRTARAGVFAEKARLWLLLGTVVFAALAQGVVDAWSVAIFELLGVLLILLWVFQVAAEKVINWQVPELLLPILAFFALGLLHGLAFTSATGERKSLSMDVEATRKAVLVFFFLLIGLLTAANLFGKRTRLRAVANFLVVYGLLMAMFALVQHFTWNGKFYWFKPNKHGMSPFGPFVSHNHFAGYMEMLIPLAAALAVAPRQKLEARLFYGFAAAMMSVAAVASLSRGGMISLAATFVFFAAGLLFYRSQSRGESPAGITTNAHLRNRHRRSRRALSGTKVVGATVKGALLAAAVAGVLLVGLIWIGPDRLAGRMNLAGAQPSQETFYGSRGWIWRDAWTMIANNPVFGVGLGAFETAYPRYSKSDGSLAVGQAHNDYLQVLADAGIIGGILALWFLIYFFRDWGRGIRSPDDVLRVISLGSGAGIFAILVHSIFDFNLQLPSNVLLFFLLVAMLAQAVSLTRRIEDGHLQEEKALMRGAAPADGKSLRR